MYTLLTDAEATFSGFSEVCASAGEDGCKILALLDKGATGEEVKRLIEDAHDVRNQPGLCFLFPTHIVVRSWPSRFGWRTQTKLSPILSS
jgi:hypothetical protein